MTTKSTHGSFDDMTHEEEQDVLYELVTVSMLLAMGDVYSIAKEELHNEILEAWAEKNDRCIECGAKLIDDGDCPVCDGEPEEE